MTHAEIIVKINESKREMERSGPIHKRDLKKYIRRLEKQLLYSNSYNCLTGVNLNSQQKIATPMNNNAVAVRDNHLGCVFQTEHDRTERLKG